MKARVKATGEIVEVGIDYNQDADYIAPNGQLYWQGELDFINLNIKDMREETVIDAINDIDSIRCMVEDIHGELTNSPDYWTRLEHQYAGMAMQTMLATLYNPKYHKELMACYTEVDAEEVARLSKYYAHALVEKMKEERK